MLYVSCSLSYKGLRLDAGDLQAVSLSFNFEPFLDSILAEDLGAAGESGISSVNNELYVDGVEYC